MRRFLPFVSALVTSAFLGASNIVNAASPTAIDIAGRSNGFAADLYAQLNKTNADKNIFLSPYSISAALGMTAQGARGKTADQMNKVLNIGPDF